MSQETDSTTCESCGSPLLDDEPSCWRCGHHPGVEIEASPPRPVGVTALALLNGVVGLSAFATAGWALLVGGLPWLGFFAATYGVLRWAAAPALWNLRPEGRTLQRIFSFLELPLFPVGTVLSILVLLYLRKPAIEALFAREADPRAHPMPVAPDRGDETILAVVSAGFAGLVVAATVILLLMGSEREAEAGKLPTELAAQLPSCTEPAGVSRQTTELWRLPMDEVVPVPDPYLRATFAIDPTEKVEGRASTKISATGPTYVPIAEMPIESYRLGQPIDGRTVFVRARIRVDRALRGGVRLSSRVSAADLVTEDRADDRDPVDAPLWREHELLYVASPDDRNGRHEIAVSIDGPGTVWIDDVRILRGPRFEGAGWSDRLNMERIRRPATGVEEVLAHLIAEEGEDAEVVHDDEEDLLFQAFQGRPEGVLAPDRVQRCLTELLLSHSARADRSLLAAAWRRLTGGKKVSARMVYWRQTILGFRRPDYLERLVRLSPDSALVETYGREVLPHMLGHGRALLGLPAGSEAEGEDTGAQSAVGRVNSHFRAYAFVEMTAYLLAGVDAGRWELTEDERGELRALLEEHYRLRGDEDPAFPFADMQRSLLVSTLERLGSEVAPGEPASPPAIEEARPGATS